SRIRVSKPRRSAGVFVCPRPVPLRAPATSVSRNRSTLRAMRRDPRSALRAMRLDPGKIILRARRVARERLLEAVAEFTRAEDVDKEGAHFERDPAGIKQQTSLRPAPADFPPPAIRARTIMRKKKRIAEKPAG